MGRPENLLGKMFQNWTGKRGNSFASIFSRCTVIRTRASGAGCGYWSWAAGGVSSGARIAAALILAVYLLAEFPLLYAAWVSTQAWPGTTPLGSYYPIWVIQRDIRNMLQNKKKPPKKRGPA